MKTPGRKHETAIAVLDPDGSRTAVEGTGVVATFGDGRELRVKFSRHPMSDGGVVLRSEFVPPGTEPRPLDPRHPPSVYARMTLHPAGGNLMRIGIDVVEEEPGSLRIDAAAPAPGPALFSVKEEVRSPLASRMVHLSLGNGAELVVGIGRAAGSGLEDHRDMAPGNMVAIHAGAHPTREELERMLAGGAISSSTLFVSFGGGNLIHVLVQRDEAGRAIRSVGDAVDMWLMAWTREGLLERVEEAAAVLGPEVIGVLVDRLSSGESPVREGAHDLLVQLTGKDLPVPSGTGDAEVLAWRRWWEGTKDRLSFDSATRRFVAR